LHLDPLQSSLAFIAGLYLGWLTERLGGVRPAMVAHAFNNAAFVALTSLDHSGEDDSRGGARIVLAAGLIVFAASTALLRTRAVMQS
jgi:membrane protease YdiL (CAAX protease family)